MKNKTTIFCKVIFSVVTTASLLLLVFSLFSLFPFGMNTLSWGDMDQQVSLLMSQMKDILSGESDILLNLQNAGGMSFWGVFFFFLSSPFNLLVYFIEKQDVYFLCNILVILKITLCSCSAAIFFSKTVPKLHLVLVISLSTAYAISGFSLLYYQNLMWIDMQYLFPLLLLSLLRLIRHKKNGLFVFIFSCMLIASYYLSYMLCLFIAFFSTLWIYFTVTKEKRSCSTALLALSIFASVGITCAVWLPSFMQYIESARTGNFVDSISRGSFFTNLSTTLPILFCTPMVFLAIKRKRIKLKNEFEKEKLVLSAIFFMMIVPLIIDPINKAWHTGSYQAFPVRYGYILIFIAIWILAINLSKKQMNHIFVKKYALILSILSVACIALLGFFLFNNNYKSLTKYLRSLWFDFTSSALFAIVSISCAIVYSLILWFKNNQKISEYIFSYCWLALTLVSTLFFSSILIGGAANPAEYKQKKLMQIDKLPNQGIYRVKQIDHKQDANLIGALGYPTLSHYTSLTGKTFYHTTKLLGYSAYWLEVSSLGGTVITDMLLGNAYTLDGNNQLIKSKYGKPLGLVLPKNRLPESLNKNNRLLQQKEILTSILGASSGFQLYSPKIERDGGELFYQIEVDKKQTLYLDFFSGVSTLVNDPINNSIRVEVNGKVFIEKYPQKKNNGLQNLGTFEDEKIEIKIIPISKTNYRNLTIAGITTEEINRLDESIKAMILNQNKNEISGFYSANVGESLFIPIALQDGMIIHVNGEIVSPRIVLDGFFEIPLATGKNFVKLTYWPKGLKFGFFISCLSLVIFSLFKLLNLNKIILNKTILLKNILFNIQIFLSTVFFIFIYFFPVFLYFFYSFIIK